MLFLSRKVGEKIVLGWNDVTIVIVEIRGNQVRIGIEAPPSIPVNRPEVLKKKLDAGVVIDEIGVVERDGASQ